ncbi:acyltransferase [Brevibacillus sp. SYSU BS000544]|uniref:acyltransferase n=1 Tax=Brevibacillus sp. SYSU BS000544 TaxID=3416443 RepID=UPI003CE460FC
MGNRLREFDLVRAFAALSVIAIHVTAGYVTTSEIGYVWNQTMRYAVPLFVMLSGFMLFYVDRGREPISYGQFIRSRFRKIVIPYGLWTAIYFLYSTRNEWTGWLQHDPLKPITLFSKQLLTGTGYVHLYFLLITVQLYILYPFLKQWMERHAASLIVVSFGLTLFSQTMIYLHQIQVLVLPSLGIPYVSLFPIWLFYFTFGMLAAQKKSSWEEKLRGKVIPLGFVWLGSLVLLIADSKLTLTHASSIKPSVMIYCFTSYFFFYVVALAVKEMANTFSKWMDWLAVHSFMIFLVHPLVISLLLIITKKAGYSFLWKGAPGMLLLYVMTTLFTVLATHLLRFVPYIELLGGVRMARKQKETKQVPMAS